MTLELVKAGVKGVKGVKVGAVRSCEACVVSGFTNSATEESIFVITGEKRK